MFPLKNLARKGLKSLSGTKHVNELENEGNFDP